MGSPPSSASGSLVMRHLERRPEAVESLLRAEARKPVEAQEQRVVEKQGSEPSENDSSRENLASALEGLMGREERRPFLAQPAFENLLQLRSLPDDALQVGVSDGEDWPCLSVLDSQVRGMIPNGSDLEKRLLESLVDYINFSAMGLRASKATQSSVSVDEALCQHLRQNTLAAIKEFVCIRAASANDDQMPDVEEEMMGVKGALEASAKVEDVGGKRRALIELWNRSISAMQRLRLHTQLASEAGVAFEKHAIANAQMLSKDFFAQEKNKLNKLERDLLLEDVRLNSDVKVAEQALKRVQDCAQQQRSEERKAEEDYQKELSSLLDLIVPKMQSLKSKFLAMKEKRDAASSAMLHWGEVRSQCEELKNVKLPETRRKIQEALTGIQASNDALDSCAEGIRHTFDLMEKLHQEQDENQRSKLEQIQEAWANTYDVAWSSLWQSKTRNGENMREFEADRERIKEGLAAALDRLDGEEEMQLQQELRKVEARAREAEADNAVVEDHLSQVEDAIKGLLDVLHSGKAGRPLTLAEKQLSGIQPNSWAYKLGNCIVRDKKMDAEMMAIKYRQQRLEQLRKSHQREFERIQHLKQQLQNDSKAHQVHDENTHSPPFSQINNAENEDIQQGKHSFGSLTAFGDDVANKRRRA